jgi:predicted nucleic acid-binding protein
MYHLIIDTCVWIDLSTKLTEVREKVSDLVDREKVRLIVPQIVVDEWNKHKQAKIVDARKASIRGMVKNARALCQYLEQSEADDLRKILNGFREREDEIEDLALEEARAIEDLFNHPSTIILPITDEVKLQAVGFALAKKAPFQSKNSMADALIILSAVDYISRQNPPNCIFVSSNTTDFSSQSDKTQIHEDLKELFDEHDVGYFSNIGLAINEIEEELVSIESIRRIEKSLWLTAVQEALERQRQIMEQVSTSALRLSALQSAAQEATERYHEMMENFKPTLDASALDAMQAVAESQHRLIESVKSTMDLSAIGYAAQVAAESYRRMTEALGSTEAFHRMVESDEIDRQKPSQPSQGEIKLEKAEMDFAVYVNHPTNTATIHSTACRYYKNRVTDKTDNGHWKKPFSCFEDAQTYASGKGKRRTRNCKVCLTDTERKN